MRAASEWLRRRGRIKPAFVDAAFPQQREFMCDDARELAACCGRRSGKSMALAGRLLLAAERVPGEMVLYIAQTKNNARMIVGRALMNMSRIYGLGLVMKEIDNRLNVIHPNGSHIWLAGAHHREAFEDFRGHKFSEIQLDEAQVHGAYLKEAMEAVLDNCRSDFKGPLVLSGTPSAVPAGYFHAVTTGLDYDEFGTLIPQWPTHSWTMAENKFFQNGKGEQYREQLRVKYHWAADHPTFLREYFGQWVHDPGALVYPFDADRNTFCSQLRCECRNADGTPRWHVPNAPMVKVLGIDLGYEDSTAFVLLGYVPGSPKVYVLETWKRQHLIPSAIAAHIESWRREHKPGIIVADAGALGKGYTEEFNQRYNLGVQYAEKQHKMAYAELLRGDFISGTILVDPFKCGALLDELSLLQWNEEHDGFDERFQDHCADALLYAWRAAKAYYRPEFEGPKEGSPEWLNAQVTKAKTERAKEIKRRARKSKQ